jgi:hypothetical protein
MCGNHDHTPPVVACGQQWGLLLHDSSQTFDMDPFILASACRGKLSLPDTRTLGTTA